MTYAHVCGTDYTGIDWRCRIPVYEYQCRDCGKKFEIVATLAEKEAGLDPACPKCGRMRACQVFSRFTLLTGSKTEDDFDEGLDEAGLGDELGGLGGGAGMEGLDDLDGGDPDGLDDLD